MAYRDDAGDVFEAPTAEGTLRLQLAPRLITVSVAARTLHLANEHAVLIEHKKSKAKDKRTSISIAGRLVVARGVPREDLGVWIELPGGMRRIFGVEPVNLLEPAGLGALAALDRLAQRLRTALADYDLRRASEIGHGLDKVLIADHADRYLVYTRRLFRDRARLAMTVHSDGRIVIGEGKTAQEITVRSRHGVDVLGDHLRFAGPDGVDLAKVSMPWIGPEDRWEIARRIGHFVDRAAPPFGGAAGGAHPTGEAR